MKNSVKIETIKAILSSSVKAGQIFSTTFIKKNGDSRKMVCRLKVTKHLRGGESTTKHIDRLLTVFDMQKEAYRCVDLEKVTELKVAGECFSFKADEAALATK